MVRAAKVDEQRIRHTIAEKQRENEPYVRQTYSEHGSLYVSAIINVRKPVI